MQDDVTVVLAGPRPGCSTCGGPLPQDAGEGVCPACAALRRGGAPEPAEFRLPGYENPVALARGGMGVVYRARQIRPARDVAIKLLLTHLTENAEMLARFQTEARAMAALDHPGILPVYEVGEVDGTPFFSMKLASGGTLAQRLEAGPLPLREAAGLIAGLCRALHCAHQHGVLHRDLKPENFLFDEEGRACISDFGLAKFIMTAPADSLTKPESFFGTPHYMPPEVATGSVREAGTPADIYSMGAVLFQCLSGQPPYGQKDSLGALLHAIAHDRPAPLRTVRPGLPRDLEVICARAMESDPAARYASAAEMAGDLERWLEGRPITARPAGAMETVWRWARRHPLTASLAGALLLTALTGSALLAASHRQRGVLLEVANARLHRSLFDQARAERLLGTPGHRQRGLNLLRQAAEILPSAAIRDEAAALLVRPDIRETDPALSDPGMHAAGTSAKPPPPPPTASGDLVTGRVPSPDGRWELEFYESGRAAVRHRGAAGPDKFWSPPPGRAISGGILPDGSALILADTEDGLLRISRSTMEAHVLAPPGQAAVTGLALDPSGSRVALGTSEGLQVRFLSDGKTLWQTMGAPVRCPPAWLPDGTRLAAATGDFRGVSLFEAASGSLTLTIPTGGWPTAIAVHPQGHVLAIGADDPSLTVAETTIGRVWATLVCPAENVRFSPSGQHLLAGGRAWLLESPAGLREWQATPGQIADDAVFDLALSPDGRHLLTTATSGVRIWSVADARQTGFHAAENQRIDAPTSAWWLDHRTLLVQVPGGLERVLLDESGQPGPARRVPRPPGSSVMGIHEDGTWLVRLTAEDESSYWEWWPAGDAGRATPAPAGASPTRKDRIQVDPDGSVLLSYSGNPLRVTPPETGVRNLLLSSAGDHLFVLAARHRVFAWDLGLLSSALAEAGFPFPH